MSDEREFVNLLQQGDRAAFSRLVEQHSSMVFRLAMNMLGNQPDAEDVLQNTFLKAYQHISGFKGNSSLSTWLFRIATNEALMLLRRHKPETAFSDAGNVEEDRSELFPSRFTDWCCLPEEEFLSAESRQAMDTAVKNLPEGLRIVFILRDLEGLSIEETSKALNLSIPAVKTRLLRARLRLREELSGFFTEQVEKRSEK
jgi:RNA polymerase sigma-70 factor (ECF subfamily)